MNNLQGMSEALKFKTQSGVAYLYDDCSGLIFPVEPALLENRYAENGAYLNIECNEQALPSEITPEHTITHGSNRVGVLSSFFFFVYYIDVIFNIRPELVKGRNAGIKQ